MNQIERSVRSLLNPYSTAFAVWWCDFGRHWRLPSALTGGRAAADPAPLMLESCGPADRARADAGRDGLPSVPDDSDRPSVVLI